MASPHPTTTRKTGIAAILAAVALVSLYNLASFDNEDNYHLLHSTAADPRRLDIVDINNSSAITADDERNSPQKEAPFDMNDSDSVIGYFAQELTSGAADDRDDDADDRGQEKCD